MNLLNSNGKIKKILNFRFNRNVINNIKVKKGNNNEAEGGKNSDSSVTNEMPFIVSNVDSKTKGYEKYADCFVSEFGEKGAPIKKGILNSKPYRI